MNGAPDWQDGDCCFRCRTQFTLVDRKHHCRNCGQIFCAKCSSQQTPLPRLNIEKSVRVCDGCYEKLSNKNADPLASVMNTKSNEIEKKKDKVKSGSSKTVSSGSNNKSPANASAPSEQELKEEEELQLALALSLSEAPTKVSFPDCKQFEEPIATSSSTSASLTPANDSRSQNVSTSSSISNHKSVVPAATHEIGESSKYPLDFDKQASVSNQPPPPQYHMDVTDKDQELFRFVAEVQSTAEVFTNRINSNKMRNRPITNDTAIQQLFLKLTDMHAELLKSIKQHDEERATYENLQDKLSQISDARAALDALREEHQEKMRQEAAEADRQRQSQLASKLEMMRQKKSQMMQYQREMALQRIQAQEMMLNQSTSAGVVPPANSIPTGPGVQQSYIPSGMQQSGQQPAVPPTTDRMVMQLQNSHTVQNQVSQDHLNNIQPQQQISQPPPQQQQPQHSQQSAMFHVQATTPGQQHFLPQPVPQRPPDDEAPLISFDD